jgi:hypothetical protein
MKPGDFWNGSEIERELGRGGMGIVYLALRGEEQVALKVIRPELAEGQLDSSAQGRADSRQCRHGAVQSSRGTHTGRSPQGRGSGEVLP